MPSGFKLVLLLVLGSVLQVSGFSLLGPYADWMDRQKGYRLPGEIGGPMGLHEEYRWNIPDVYYGFDQSFLDAFGQEGVQAVEAAVAILNSVPHSSGIQLDDYPLHANRFNYIASAAGVMDMKSLTLQRLLEQMGLASPERFLYSLREIRSSPTTNFAIVQRNYDPAALWASDYINGVLYTTDMVIQHTNESPVSYQVHIIPVDPSTYLRGSVADQKLRPGEFLNLLSRDDVGGLRYLLSSMNWNVEPLLPNIEFVFSNPPRFPPDGLVPYQGTNFIETALRPGVEKITFRRLHRSSSDENIFVSVTNYWTDTFSISNEVQSQYVRRIVSVPDILFSAEDMGVQVTITPAQTNGTTITPMRKSFTTSGIKRTDASRWINCSSLNNNPGGAGPGVIVPGVKITFPDNRRYLSVGPASASYLSDDGGLAIDFNTMLLASFDGSTNQPVVLAQPMTNIHTASLEFTASEEHGTEWIFLANFAGIYNVESSTNLTDWTTVQVFTNLSSIVRFTDPNLDQRKFYRARRVGAWDP